MKKTALIACLQIMASSFSYGQSWLWGAQATNTASSFGEGYSAATDKNGNVFFTGWFENNMFFNATSLTTPPGGAIDAYLAKYNSGGSLVWVIQSNTPSSSSLCEATSIATDVWGNSFMVGNYEDTAILGTFTLKDVTPPFYLDGMWVAKISPTGGVIWAKQSKAANSTCGGNINAVTTDKAGNVYITGWFINTVSFGSDTLKTSGTGCFLIKYDSAGNVIWAKQSTANNAAIGLADNVDKYGDIYITGYFYQKTTFGIYPLSSIYTQDMFLVKYSSTGNVLWAKQANVATANSQIDGLGVTSDISGNPYITGYFYDTAYIGSHTLSTNKDTDAFIAKYDTNGNVAWVVQANNIDNNDWLGYSICADTLNHIYIACGGFGPSEKNPNIELIFGVDTFKTTNAGFDDASVIAMFDTTGKTVCGIITPSVGDDDNTVTCDASGKYIYFSGDLGRTATFGPDVLTFSGTEAPVVARWQPCSVTGISEVQNVVSGSYAYPNPNNGRFTINSSGISGKSTIEIYNMLGEKVYTSNLPTANTEINLSDKPNGVYFYRITSETGDLVSDGKFITL